MSSEPRSFLHARAKTEALNAARAECGTAALSHAHLARLYLARCAGTPGNAIDCLHCDMELLCLAVERSRATPGNSLARATLPRAPMHQSNMVRVCLSV